MRYITAEDIRVNSFSVYVTRRTDENSESHDALQIGIQQSTAIGYPWAIACEE